MIVTRRTALAAFASAVFAGCGGSSAVKVGSKNFTESILIAEIYARALEDAGIRVVRRLDLGSTQIAMAAMKRGDIDLYPEYTGTALIDVLHDAPLHDAQAIYTAVKTAFAREFGIDWLQRSPMNDSQGLATTKTISRRYGLTTLTQLAGLAPHLRLATIPEFVSRPDGLPGLQRVYGGFRFASVRTYDISLKYQALAEGQADVATAFTTDGEIVTDNLVVLEDDKHLWPAYNVAPLVRATTLERVPRIATVLNGIAPRITDRVTQSMNARIESNDQDPADVARAFLHSTSAA